MSLRGYKKKWGKANWTMLPSAIEEKPKEITKKSFRPQIKPMSKKRQKESREYSKLRIEFLTANPFCQRCGNPATDVHHWAGRRSNYLKTETWRASCNPCNLFAKDEPAKAIAENWRAPVGVYLT